MGDKPQQRTGSRDATRPLLRTKNWSRTKVCYKAAMSMTFPQLSPGWCAHNSNYEDLCSMNAGIFHFCTLALSPTSRPPSRSACGPIYILARDTCQQTAFIRRALQTTQRFLEASQIYTSIHPRTSISVTDVRPWKKRLLVSGRLFYRQSGE